MYNILFNEVSRKTLYVQDYRIYIVDMEGYFETESMFVFIFISTYPRIDVYVCVGEGKEGMIGLSCY